MINDLIFPYNCIGCGTELKRGFLCSKCHGTLFEYVNIICPVCSKRLVEGKICQNCNVKLYLKRFVVAMPYHHPIGKTAIHNLKYLFVKDLAQPLGATLAHALHYTIPDYVKYNLLAVPIPLSNERLRSRGFNQSFLIAQTVSRLLGVELAEDEILQRRRSTTPQLGLSRKLREENVRGAFAIDDAEKIQNRNILLIDDVATTCSTLKECAIILKQNGARSVWAAVVAKE
ncbi:MAG: hypothetical protein A3A80_03980 [Candidatus Terrybacteria bacterium RIFCSPLOWO2_01_FULL_44_24]|uniref:Double zinc ribbon domain-containing protein n=1 Tax=Candidatus Terrybacteria bacterium RIFCSPHIGHO2_01_FULL_43_35 TaxID=1802361 RepID=A0A1G2PG81_9BACT|nr:MAG: hypothetical protein A2828_02905 [Candidatus Terrybacteria bacterium RIFCSPHIGHO2_01_FULL_43_35]OHA50169.1 MAG: hypothetical protein A3B75_01565 [Candidatus Terrybacteria bacterium RIFCSPHIGHO2_02_FULL_43_14]OHA51228.1 MAG: hypothetical protein A3A80_03980 [Candidatus Terrybacteria bacterium RIFCSPLOWO2_01_FULL_44_24]